MLSTSAPKELSKGITVFDDVNSVNFNLVQEFYPTADICVMGKNKI